MSFLHWALVFESGLILVLMYWVNALINKCMSHSFYDYQISKGMDKKLKQDNMDVKTDDDAEDIGGLVF